MNDQTVSEHAAEGGQGAQAVDRALSLLSLVARSGAEGVTLAGIVLSSGLNKPTARRLLVALIRSRLVEQEAASRRYFLGQEAYVLGALAAPRHGLLTCAADSLRTLVRKTGDTAFVSVRHGDFSLCLHRQEGTHPVRSHVLQAGAEHPLGVGAGSLAMLAALPPDEAEAVIDRLSGAYSVVGSYSADRVRSDVQQTRTRGHAINPGRFLPSSWGIAVAVHFPDGRVAGALSIATVDSRLRPDRQNELAQHLAHEAKVVNARLAQLFAGR